MRLYESAAFETLEAEGRPERWAGAHKPLLVLVLIELACQELLPKGVLPLTPELAFRFCTYWSIVAHRRRQKPDVRYPFHHLQSDGCWKSLGEDGKPSPDRRLTQCAHITLSSKRASTTRPSATSAKGVDLQLFSP